MTELTTLRSGGAVAELTQAWLAGIANPHTANGYKSAVRSFWRWLSGEWCGERLGLEQVPVNLGTELDADVVRSYLEAMLADGISKSTCNHRLSGIKAWVRELVSAGAMSPARAEDILRIPGYRSRNRTARQHLNDDQIQTLLDSVPAGRDASLKDIRDRALLALLAWTGLRRSELCALNVGQLEKVNGFSVLNSIRRKGGNVTDFVKLQPALAGAIAAWLKAAGITEPDAPLFQSVDKSGNLKHKRLTGEAIRLILRERLAQAGLPMLSPHDLRRSFATNALAAGATLEAVRVGGGWTSFRMPQLYNQGKASLENNATDVLDYRL